MRQEREARRLVRDRSGGACEVCDQRRAVEFQHRKNRSQGGQWSASNGLDLCSDCHRHIHANPAEADAEGWTVRQWEHPDDKPVLTYCGYRRHDDYGDVTLLGWQRPVLEHVDGCDWWHTNECDRGCVA